MPLDTHGIEMGVVACHDDSAVCITSVGLGCPETYVAQLCDTALGIPDNDAYLYSGA